MPVLKLIHVSKVAPAGKRHQPHPIHYNNSVNNTTIQCYKNLLRKQITLSRITNATRSGANSTTIAMSWNLPHFVFHWWFSCVSPRMLEVNFLAFRPRDVACYYPRAIWRENSCIQYGMMRQTVYLIRYGLALTYLWLCVHNHWYMPYQTMCTYIIILQILYVHKPYI